MFFVMAETAKKILFVNAEMFPYLPETDIAKICRELPQGIQERKREIRAFMPRYGCINERKNQLHEVIRLSGMNIIIADVDRPLVIKVASISSARIQVYFIDNEDYFRRKQVYRDEDGTFFKDNGERAIFFARGVLETVKKLRWAPDVILCQGWMAAAIPIYVKTAYHEEPTFANTKVVTSLFEKQIKTDLGNKFKRCLEFRNANASLLEPYSEKFDFMELGKLAIDYSDGVIEAGQDVSPELIAYARSTNVPYLDHPEGDFTDPYLNFFNTIAPDAD